VDINNVLHQRNKLLREPYDELKKRWENELKEKEENQKRYELLLEEKNDSIYEYNSLSERTSY
jgi:hypothetical protein